MAPYEHAQSGWPYIADCLTIPLVLWRIRPRYQASTKRRRRWEDVVAPDGAGGPTVASVLEKALDGEITEQTLERRLEQHLQSVRSRCITAARAQQLADLALQPPRV